MTEAVFVAGWGMWISMTGIMVIGAIGGILLYVSERIAAKRRPEEH